MHGRRDEALHLKKGLPGVVLLQLTSYIGMQDIAEGGQPFVRAAQPAPHVVAVHVEEGVILGGLCAYRLVKPAKRFCGFLDLPFAHRHPGFL